MTRVQYIDRLKGLAIILVVMGHIFGFSQPEDGINTFIYTFHMPLFMFLSGLVISAPPHLKKVFTKWKRFLVPFFVVGFACTFYRQSTLNEFFQSGSKGGYWYLWVLAVFYLLLSLFKYCCGRKEIIREILLASIIYIVFKMLIRVFNIPGNHDIFSVGRCLEMWPYFMLGFFTRKYNLLTYIHRYPAIASVAAVTFIITFFGVIEYCGYNLGRFYKLASATMLVFLLYVFSSREDMKTKLENQLALIGRYSLEVYIFHYFFLVNTNISFIQSWAMTTHNGLIELLLLVVISVTIAYLSMFIGWLFHQEKWLSRIIYGG